MRKIVIITLFISMAFLSAQESPVISDEVRTSKNSIYALGYGGILTIGYQRLVTDRLGINVSAASIALLHEDLRDGFSFPVHLSYYPIGTVHRLFLDLGCNFITKGKSNPLFDFYDGGNIPIIVGAGYNYHPVHGGLFAKAGAGLFIYSPHTSVDLVSAGIIFGLAIGRSF